MMVPVDMTHVTPLAGGGSGSAVGRGAYENWRRQKRAKSFASGRAVVKSSSSLKVASSRTFERPITYGNIEGRDVVVKCDGARGTEELFAELCI